MIKHFFHLSKLCKEVLILLFNFKKYFNLKQIKNKKLIFGCSIQAKSYEISLEFVKRMLSSAITLAKTNNFELGSIPNLHNYYLFAGISLRLKYIFKSN